MKPKPVDPYAISKVASEEVLKNLCELNGIEWVIAIPHKLLVQDKSMMILFETWCP